jgi:hypothetical protein
VLKFAREVSFIDFDERLALLRSARNQNSESHADLASVDS